MPDQKKEEKKQTITAYEASLQIQPQSQELPGAEHKMDPQPECSKLEHWDKDGRPYLKEYVGSAKLEGKKAIITGGDSGIGKAVAIFFAREGADLSLVYLPDEQKDAENTQAEISRTTGRKVNLIPVDLRDKSSYQTIVKSHNQAFGNQIDILVNNASQQILKKDIKDVMDKDIEETFQANIIQMIGLTREIVPHLKRGASIVNTTSVTAYQGSPQFIDYSSTKGAIVSFTRALAGQLAPKGIRVNGVAPGPVYTPLQPASRTPENMEDWGIGDVPLHGRAAQPAEMAEAYVLLAGPGGNYITGTIIHANGGKHIGGA